MTTLDLGSLGLDRGAGVLLKRALRALPDGGSLAVRGSDPHLAVHLRGWCRGHGIQAEWTAGSGDVAILAKIIPARFLGLIHPHFREVLQVLAVQAADEARHIEVFTRRANLRRSRLGNSSAGGQASLKTLLDEHDFALASFLLSVLGEGSFLALLRFLHEHAPDPITREITRLAAQDEARHVAFGMAHLRRHAGIDPSLRSRLAAAVERRHDALRHTAGLNEEVFDALTLLAAGSWEPSAIAAGHARVVDLTAEMDRGRRMRLIRLGFPVEQAETLSGLHTRNFM